MTYRKYKMKLDSSIEPKVVKGTIVYDLKGWDYGSANEDTRVFGNKHKSVTLNSDGDYPYFTVPESILEVIEE